MKSAHNSFIPSFREEKQMLDVGHQFVAGVDEVGRGCLAGPVMASAVILPYPFHKPWLKEVRDSKMLSPQKRAYLYCQIEEAAIAIGIGVISQDIIDTFGIAKASRLAMKQAIEKITPPVDCLLIDYFRLPEVSLPQRGVLHGDGLCYSIACASIVAKVTRDQFMQEMDATYPGYGFYRNKGYGTAEHRHMIHELGLSSIHRRSFCHEGLFQVEDSES
jgi:ribonuclease HII